MAGQLVSQLGDKFHMIALAFWVLNSTGSSGKMGAVLAASLLPSLIIGLFSGSFIDRYSKKKIIVGTDLIRGMVLLGFAWMFAKGQMNFHLILVLQAILSINAAFFDPAIPAVIPRIVPKDSLARANAVHQGINSFALIGGAVLGGMAVAGLGIGWIFVLNGFSFFISGGFEFLIEIPEKKDIETRSRLVSEIWAGYNYLLNSRPLMGVLSMVMVIHFFVGGIEVVMPVVAAQGPGRGAELLGLFQAALGAGTLVMSLFLTRFTIAGKEKTALFSSVVAMGGIQGAASFIPGLGILAPAGFALCFFAWGGAMIRAAVAFKTLLQSYTDNAFQGRVFALASTVGNASVPVSMIVSGFLLDRISAETGLAISGAILAGLGMVSLKFLKEEK